MEFGWIPDLDSVKEVCSNLYHPTFADTEANNFTDIPTEIKPWNIVKLPARNQGKIGSCTAFGASRALEYTNIVEINEGDNEVQKPLSREIIYGFARVSAANNRFKGQDGCTGAYTAQALNKFGTLSEETIGAYDVVRCKKYGDDGVPSNYAIESQSHKCQVTLVKTIDEAIKALAQGYFISVCSNQGFELRRNEEGIAKPSGVWWHCMACIGAKKVKNSWLFAIENSWGEQSTKGPIVDLPHAGCFWIDQDVFGRMIGRGDSWAFSSYAGFAKKQIQWRF